MCPGAAFVDLTEHWQRRPADGRSMQRRVFVRGSLLNLLSMPALAADPLPTLRETPMFADRVKSGTLLPVAERIPRTPRVIKTFPGGDGPGRQGGQLNMLVS